MKLLSIPALIFTSLVVAVSMFIVAGNLYSFFPPVPLSPTITLGAMAGLCALLAVSVKSKISHNRIGFDRTQLEPTRVATYAIIAQASAWTGAIFFGAYVGLGAYLLPHMSVLIAAQEDMPYICAAMVSSLLLAIAGVWLERCCQAPPPSEEK